MNGQTSRRLRQLHRHIGLFFTPAILFFALSGAMQTLGLHESRGSPTPPPEWIRWMAGIHKNQAPPRARPSEGDHAPGADSLEAAGHRHDDAGDRHGAADRHGGGDHVERGRSAVPLKAFVLLMALALIASSLLGATIAIGTRSTRRSALIALALGVIVPVLLLFA